MLRLNLSKYVVRVILQMKILFLLLKRQRAIKHVGSVHDALVRLVPESVPAGEPEVGRFHGGR